MELTDPLLRTQQVATALGVGVSTVKRWVDSGELRATRTVGKHRLIALSDVLKFAVEQGRSNTALERLRHAAISPTFGVCRVDDQIQTRFVEALRQGRTAECRRLILEGYSTAKGAVTFADDLIRPVMAQIGEGWMCGSLDVYQEHEATQIILFTLSEIIAEASRTTQLGAPIAVGAAPEGDFYSLPGMLAELVLREQGWNVRNLGCNLPLASLTAAVGEYRPKLVFLSVSDVPDTHQFLREYSLFYEAASRLDVAVMLGVGLWGPTCERSWSLPALAIAWHTSRSLLAGYCRRSYPPRFQLNPVRTLRRIVVADNSPRDSACA